MGQLNEQMPHCTQRLGSGTTQAEARAACLSLSDLNQFTRACIPPAGRERTPSIYRRASQTIEIEATIRPATYASYSTHVNVRIAPRIGRALLQALTAGHLNRLYADLAREGKRVDDGKLAAGSVHRIHATLHPGLRDAVRLGLLFVQREAVCARSLELPGQSLRSRIGRGLLPVSQPEL